MVKKANWYDYDDGYTLGTSGTDGGIIARDEEYEGGARLTIEEEASSAPFTLTCTIYGWMSHARFFVSENEANEEFEAMKADLEKLLAFISEDEEVDEETREAVAGELEEFVEMYP